LETSHKGRKHHAKKSNQELLYMAMKGSTLGAYDETDTADYWKQKQREHSSDDYVDDTPEAYGWVTADVQLKANNLMRTKPENWGDMDAAFADHKDSIKDNQSDHSNNEKYVEDAPSGDYAEAVDYDVVQLEQHLKMTQMTLPENWGDLAAAQEEYREGVHTSVVDHTDEEDFKEDSPEVEGHSDIVGAYDV
jgi:hypothetical protein